MVMSGAIPSVDHCPTVCICMAYVHACKAASGLVHMRSGAKAKYNLMIGFVQDMILPLEHC